MYDAIVVGAPATVIVDGYRLAAAPWLIAMFVWFSKPVAVSLIVNTAVVSDPKFAPDNERFTVSSRSPASPSPFPASSPKSSSRNTTKR